MRLPIRTLPLAVPVEQVVVREVDVPTHCACGAVLDRCRRCGDRRCTSCDPYPPTGRACGPRRLPASL